MSGGPLGDAATDPIKDISHDMGLFGSLQNAAITELNTTGPLAVPASHLDMKRQSLSK